MRITFTVTPITSRGRFPDLILFGIFGGSLQQRACESSVTHWGQ
jgi:hypothetical protein